MIDDSLAALGTTPQSFLDPCCGTGRYLLRAAARFNMAPDQLHGFDSDPVSVDIARINCLLHYPDRDFMPDIRCLDPLRDADGGLPGNIDAIATNPPWGGRRNRRGPGGQPRAIRSGESFSLFLEKSLDLLRPGGRLSFLLPEAVLRIKAHGDIRALLLARTRIRRITLLGRIFPGVFTPVLRLDAEKSPAPSGWRVEVAGDGKIHAAPQDRFGDNAGHAFDVTVTPRDEELLARIYAVPHATLAGHAEWALGIVTGDNARHVLDAPEAGAEAVLRGRDVFRFAAAAPRRYIRFRPELFQQAAAERYYRAPEKLIYRFVSDRLVFAYDDRRRLTLNSANILIPHLSGMPARAVLALLNSRVFHYVFTKRFAARKVLRGDLETLPFPLLPSSAARALAAEAERCIHGESGSAGKLDGMVFSLFNLDDNDVGAMEESLAK